MSLTTKNQLQLTIQTLKKLLSFKVDRSELPDADHAIELAMECGLISPVVSNDGFIYADENGAIYSL